MSLTDFQAHEHLEIEERLTNLEQGQVAIKADLGGVKTVLQKLLEKQ